MEIQKTDTSRSPLLKPVIQREYTKGMNFDAPKDNLSSPAPEPPNQPVTGPKPNYTPPPPGPTPTPTDPINKDIQDNTKGFAFDEVNDNPSDLQENESADTKIPAGTARTFANTIGNMVQIYLPRATYGYVKIDMESVRANVEMGNLTINWIDAFEEMNKQAEQALQIPDETMKMWKSAFQHYLEYKNIKAANPETEFWIATGVLLTDQGIRTYGLKKQLEQIMQQALEASNPGSMKQQPAAKKEAQPATSKLQNDDKLAA
jgi:hypothetical protein